MITQHAPRFYLKLFGNDTLDDALHSPFPKYFRYCGYSYASRKLPLFTFMTRVYYARVFSVLIFLPFLSFRIRSRKNLLQTVCSTSVRGVNVKYKFMYISLLDTALKFCSLFLYVVAKKNKKAGKRWGHCPLPVEPSKLVFREYCGALRGGGEREEIFQTWNVELSVT